MSDEQQSAAGKIDDLNNMLMGVENKLMHRALNRDRSELDNATDFINDMADQGMIDIDCQGCEGDGEEEASMDHVMGTEEWEDPPAE